MAMEITKHRSEAEAVLGEDGQRGGRVGAVSFDNHIHRPQCFTNNCISCQINARAMTWYNIMVSSLR